MIRISEAIQRDTQWCQILYGGAKEIVSNSEVKEMTLALRVWLIGWL